MARGHRLDAGLIASFIFCMLCVLGALSDKQDCKIQFGSKHVYSVG